MESRKERRNEWKKLVGGKGVRNTRAKGDQRVRSGFIGLSEVAWLRCGLTPETTLKAPIHGDCCDEDEMTHCHCLIKHINSWRNVVFFNQDLNSPCFCVKVMTRENSFRKTSTH